MSFEVMAALLMVDSVSTAVALGGLHASLQQVVFLTSAAFLQLSLPTK